MNKFALFFIVFSSLILIASNSAPPDAVSSVYSSNVYDTFDGVSEDSLVFTSKEVPKNIYENMLGKSIPLEYKNQVNISGLSYLQVSYYGFDEKVHVGELIVSSKVSNEVLEIFRELYDIRYPIEKIKLIDEYNASDEISMSDNNTSCFCYRVISNSSSLSNHAKGLAIDINPLYNPYIANGFISPASSSVYANRELNHKYQISKDDAVYKIFINHRVVLGW